MNTAAVISADTLTDIALSAIIAKSALLARDPEWDKWRVYEAAKGAIADFKLPVDEYEQAIKLLAAALGV